MKKISIISFYFLNLTIAQAKLEQDYQLISGPKNCPIGSISIKTDNKERTLLFGSQLAWVLNLEDKSSIKEVVEGGCTYILNYEKTPLSFVAQTQRSGCPVITENGVISESIELKQDKLHYQYEFNSTAGKKIIYKCTYNKRN